MYRYVIDAYTPCTCTCTYIWGFLEMGIPKTLGFNSRIVQCGMILGTLILGNLHIHFHREREREKKMNVHWNWCKEMWKIANVIFPQSNHNSTPWFSRFSLMKRPLLTSSSSTAAFTPSWLKKSSGRAGTGDWVADAEDTGTAWTEANF
jgi:hypothetical protein